MKRLEGIPKAGVAVALVLAFSSALALFARPETRAWSGGMRLAIAILAILLGSGALAWLLLMVWAASHSAGSGRRVRSTVQQRWWLGAGWAAFFVPLALTIQTTLFWCVASVPLALLIAMLVHESGHLAAAVLFGLRITGIQLGPLLLDLQERRLTPASVTERAGAVWAVDVYRSRPCAVVVTAAGSVANLVFAITCLVGWSSPLGLVFGLASAMTSFLNLFGSQPEQSEWKSDGKVLLDIFFHWPRLTAERKILAEVQLGLRPREWSLPLSECLAKVDDGGTLLALLTFARAMDEGQVEIGARLLEEALPIHGVPPPVRIDWFLEGATFHALVGGDAKWAGALLERARTLAGYTPGYALLAEAAVLLVQGAQENARTALAGWLDHVSRAPNPNYTRGGHEWAVDELTKRLGPAAR